MEPQKQDKIKENQSNVRGGNLKPNHSLRWLWYLEGIMVSTYSKKIENVFFFINRLKNRNLIDIFQVECYFLLSLLQILGACWLWWPPITISWHDCVYIWSVHTKRLFKKILRTAMKNSKPKLNYVNKDVTTEKIDAFKMSRKKRYLLKRLLNWMKANLQMHSTFLCFQ